jgi:two-component system OmpR family response regulator
MVFGGARLKYGCAEPTSPVIPASILVVDNHASLPQTMATVLRYEGFEVDIVRSDGAALQLVTERAFDLVVLDLVVADLNDRALRRRFRASEHDPPVLYLTAKKGAHGRTPEERAGMDDYLWRPFSMTELVVRIGSILRRCAGEELKLRFADLVMSEESREVWRNDNPVHLSHTEFGLLRLFLLKPRQVLSKHRIVDYAWHYDFSGSPDIVETYVFYLRKKLDPFGPSLIHTIRHVGYVLREQPNT